MIVLVVEPNKNPYTKVIDGSLKSMQEVTGGQIEAIYPFDEEVALVCNEEGKLLGLPPNRFLVINNSVKDIIMGTFFLCSCPSDSDSFGSLNNEQIEKYTKLFEN
ncbi:MAG: DUF3846 domain-containing protein [Clostridia bacterium]|nr:DUF3846 domain-containing protein [Clostridia bacterium]